MSKRLSNLVLYSKIKQLNKYILKRKRKYTKIYETNGRSYIKIK